MALIQVLLNQVTMVCGFWMMQVNYKNLILSTKQDVMPMLIVTQRHISMNMVNKLSVVLVQV